MLCQIYLYYGTVLGESEFCPSLLHSLVVAYKRSYNIPKTAFSSFSTGDPDSQQPSGSQIIGIYMGIYHKINKTVKVQIKSY